MSDSDAYLPDGGRIADLERRISVDAASRAAERSASIGYIAELETAAEEAGRILREITSGPVVSNSTRDSAVAALRALGLDLSDEAKVPS